MATAFTGAVMFVILGVVFYIAYQLQYSVMQQAADHIDWSALPAETLNDILLTDKLPTKQFPPEYTFTFYLPPDDTFQPIYLPNPPITVDQRRAIKAALLAKNALFPPQRPLTLETQECIAEEMHEASGFTNGHASNFLNRPQDPDL